MRPSRRPTRRSGRPRDARTKYTEAGESKSRRSTRRRLKAIDAAPGGVGTQGRGGTAGHASFRRSNTTRPSPRRTRPLMRNGTSRHAPPATEASGLKPEETIYP